MHVCMYLCFYLFIFPEHVKVKTGDRKKTEMKMARKKTQLGEKYLDAYQGLTLALGE